MASFNKVILMGNLTRDPDSRTLQSNTTVTDIGIAVNRRFKTQAGEDREEVTFVDCTAFGRTAEVIAEHFTKGKPILIDGRLKYDSWDDKGGGGKRSKLTVVVENFQFLGRANDGEDDPPERPAPRSQPVNHRGPMERPAGPMFRGGGKPRQEQVPAPFGDEQQFTDDSIPF